MFEDGETLFHYIAEIASHIFGTNSSSQYKCLQIYSKSSLIFKYQFKWTF